MKRHLSPWREMALARLDSRIYHAHLVTLLPFLMGVFSIVVSIGMVARHRFGINGTLLIHSLVLGGLFTALYGVATWRIDRRDPRGGWLAIALFAYQLGASLWRGHFLAFGTLYSVLGIALVLRAAEPLGLMKRARPSSAAA